MINKNAFRNLSYGVYVVSTLDGERPTGCVANSAMQITSEPATIAVSINHDNYTNALLSTYKGTLRVAEGSYLDGIYHGQSVKKFYNVNYTINKSVDR